MIIVWFGLPTWTIIIIIPMLLVFFLLFLKVVLSDLQFSQGVVFFFVELPASYCSMHAHVFFHIHILLAYARTHTPVTRASVRLARTHDPMLLSWQVFVPPFPCLNFPFPCCLLLHADNIIIVSFQTIDYRLGKASRETWVFRFLAIGIHGILIFVHLSRKRCIHGKRGPQQIETTN